MQSVQLQEGTHDQIIWRWSSSRVYTASSAYRMFFQGATLLHAWCQPHMEDMGSPKSVWSLFMYYLCFKL
jgi:hypothetical protein